MFNCYSGSGVAGGQATAFSLQRAFSSQLREQLCLHLEPPASTFPPRFLSFSPSVSPSPPQSLPSFHRSPSPFLAATTRPRSLLGLSAAVSINLPSLTLFNGVRSPLERDGISGRNFVSNRSPTPLRFHFKGARIGVDVREESMRSASCG